MAPPIVSSRSFNYNQLWPCTSLQHLIETSLVPDDENYPECKKFLPSFALKTIITRARVKKTLACRCPDCFQHRTTGRHYTILDEEKILGQHDASGLCYMVIFAILAYSQHPALISWFLDNNISDARLALHVADFTPEYVLQVIGRRICDASRVASRFATEKWKFTVPFMAGSGYEEYHESTILPFRNKYAMEEGSIGTVHMIEMFDGYSFTDYPDCRVFARKQLRDRDSATFFIYMQRLDFVRGLNHEHVLQHVKAYKHGENYNIIYPLAEMNASDYFRAFPTLPEVSDPLRDRPLWSQVIGLANALQDVQNGLEYLHTAYELEPNGRYVKITHLDLKPDNILVFGKGKGMTWKISDFGLSTSHMTNRASSSALRASRATKRYAAPGCSSDTASDIVSRPFDIWSLGCIMLEMLVWMLPHPEVHDTSSPTQIQSAMGTPGEEAKYLAEDSRVAMQRPDEGAFWAVNPSTQEKELSPSVIRIMDVLRRNATREDDRDFINCLLDMLARKVLVPHPRDRASAGELATLLHDIVESPGGLVLDSPRRADKGKGKITEMKED